MILAHLRNMRINFMKTNLIMKVEKIKQRIKFRKIILIAAILMVTIIGIVYASAFVIQNKDAPGTYEEIKQDESVSYANIEGVE